MFGIGGSLIGDVWSRNPENLFMELSFLAKIESTTTAGPAYEVKGDRQIDLSILPRGKRQIFFVATLSSVLAGRITHLELWDTTHSVIVTSAALDNTAAIDVTKPQTFTSPALTEGSAAGNIRSDVPTDYEIRLYRVGGTAGDSVTCHNSYLRVQYK